MTKYKILAELIDHTITQLFVEADSIPVARSSALLNPQISSVLVVEEDFTQLFADVCAGRVIY